MGPLILGISFAMAEFDFLALSIFLCSLKMILMLIFSINVDAQVFSVLFGCNFSIANSKTDAFSVSRVFLDNRIRFLVCHGKVNAVHPFCIFFFRSLWFCDQSLTSASLQYQS